MTNENMSPAGAAGKSLVSATVNGAFPAEKTVVQIVKECMDAQIPVWDAWKRVREVYPNATTADFERALSGAARPVRSPARSAIPAFVYNGTPIRDRADRLNMTDMWKAAGSPSGRGPSDWQALASASEFIAHIEGTLEAGKSGIQSQRGGRGIGGVTWAHWQIGLAYAKYLSPDFHAWCNNVVRAHMEGVPAPARIDLGAIGGMVKGIVNKAIVTAMNETLPAMIEARLTKDHRVAVGEYVPALKVCIDHGVNSKGRRGFANRVSHRLRAFCAERGIACRRDIWRGTWVFPIAAVTAWLDEEGKRLIGDHRNSLSGQTVLQFPRGGKHGKPAS